MFGGAFLIGGPPRGEFVSTIACARLGVVLCRVLIGHFRFDVLFNSACWSDVHVIRRGAVVFTVVLLLLVRRF